MVYWEIGSVFFKISALERFPEAEVTFEGSGK